MAPDTACEPGREPQSVGPERITLAEFDDPRDVIHRAVAALAGGLVIALPGDTCYLFAASALNADAIERLRTLKALDDPHPLSLGLRAAAELRDWVPNASRLASRLCRRAWPGPVTFIVEGDIASGLAHRLPATIRHFIAPASTIGLRMPANPVVREILDLIPGPIVLSNASRVGALPRHYPLDTLATLPGLGSLVDDGPRPGESPTVVSIKQDSWSVIRPGPIADSELAQKAGVFILFICTGNTCRSPMAEALFKLHLARRFGCSQDQLDAHGFVVRSAGLAAARGAPAAADAIETVASRGGALQKHRSQPVTHSLVEQADLIIAMTREHRAALLDEFPELADATFLLDPDGGDIHDPIGCGRDVYRETADLIEHCFSTLIEIIDTAPSR